MKAIPYSSSTMQKVGCCYHPKLPEQLGLGTAEELMAIAARHVDETWVAPAWDEEAVAARMPGTDLLQTDHAQQFQKRILQFIRKYRGS